MNSTRLEQLLKFLEDDPDDPFILYALALEYKSVDPGETGKLFTQLLEYHPDYLPTYYQAALHKEELGQSLDALSLYGAGIEIAKKQNNFSALKELQAAYDTLADESD